MGKRYCGVDIEQCTFLGEGHEGKVYLTPDKKVLKIFRNSEKCRAEYKILKEVEGNPHFPKVIKCRGRSMIREYVKGIPLKGYIREKGLSRKLAIHLIGLVEAFEALKFKRLDINSRHIFVQSDETVMVIDPRKTFSMKVPIPYQILEALEDAGVLECFFEVLESVNPSLAKKWMRAVNNN